MATLSSLLLIIPERALTEGCSVRERSVSEFFLIYVFNPSKKGHQLKVFYRRHEIQVNSTPQGTIIFDVFDNRKQHLLAGFSVRTENEQAVADRMKQKVDQLILDGDGKYATPSFSQRTFTNSH